MNGIIIISWWCSTSAVQTQNSHHCLYINLVADCWLLFVYYIVLYCIILYCSASKNAILLSLLSMVHHFAVDGSFSAVLACLSSSLPSRWLYYDYCCVTSSTYDFVTISLAGTIPGTCIIYILPSTTHVYYNGRKICVFAREVVHLSLLQHCT